MVYVQVNVARRLRTPGRRRASERLSGMTFGPRIGELLKIALVSPYDFPFPGGVTNHVTNLSEQFRSAGHEVHILAPSSDDDDRKNYRPDAE